MAFILSMGAFLLIFRLWMVSPDKHVDYVNIVFWFLQSYLMAFFLRSVFVNFGSI